MPCVEMFEVVRPPRTTSWLPGPGSATTRLTGAASAHGRSPDSTAEMVPGERRLWRGVEEEDAEVLGAGDEPVPAQVARRAPKAMTGTSVLAARTLRLRTLDRRACAPAGRLREEEEDTIESLSSF